MLHEIVRVPVKLEEGMFLVDANLMGHIDVYTRLYKLLKEHLVNQHNLKVIIFGYDTFMRGNTIIAVTHRGTCFRVKHKFDENMANATQLARHFMIAWNQLPSVESTKEQYIGVFKKLGKPIQFNRVFDGYRFTDKECEELLAGKKITIEYLKDEAGLIKSVGHLVEQVYRGFRFFGFKVTKYLTPPTHICSKPIPAEKRQELMDGKVVYISQLYSNKQQKHFNAYLSWNAKKGLVFEKNGHQKFLETHNPALMLQNSISLLYKATCGINRNYAWPEDDIVLDTVSAMYALVD